MIRQQQLLQNAGFLPEWSTIWKILAESLSEQSHQTMDRCMIPDPITGKAQQGLAALAAIHSKERKRVVQDYVEHLIDTQASIIWSAQEYQQKYIRSRAAPSRHNKTPPLDAYKQDDWVLAT